MKAVIYQNLFPNMKGNSWKLKKKNKPICNDLVRAGGEDSIAIFYVFAFLYVLWDILQKVSQRFL